MKLLPTLAAALLAASAPAALAAPAATATIPAAPASKRIVLPTEVRPERYDIRIAPDAAKLTFTGEARIALVVLKPTDRIVLNAADLTFGKVSLSGRADAPRVQLDEAQQTAAFVFDKPLTPGRYTLSIDYSGKIYEQASGLFALDYEAQGKTQRALFTQFENSDARRFAPLWDEPGVKAVFALTVDAPAGQMAVSNMPVAQATQLPDGRQRVRFQDSPKMSSYLAFLALGDFERIHQQVGKTDVGVVVRRGDTEKAKFALDAATKLLTYYNDYFGTPYPLPKMDMVAGPGNSQFFGAMENWGAIFYFDYVLLIDPKLSTETDRQNVFITVAHEMAHQWFGDLVTMAWWDDLWLNEGFASWMENKATDHFHPEWNIWLVTQAGQQGAMREDARAGTHPIITPIPDVFAAGTAFDGITYQKGQAVIRMLESYVGEDAFRTGVRNYMKRHAYGNTVTDDLWTELDKVSPRKVRDIAHDFTLQAGVPLIRANSSTGGLQLTQGRFGVDAGQQAPRTWRTPVTVKGLDGKAWTGVVSSAAPASAPVAAPAIVNAGQTSYFRTLYAPELWAKIAPRYGALTAADQLGLMHDSRALGEAGYAPMSDFLSLARNTPANADPVVLQTLADQLSALNRYYEGRPGREAFRAFARARLSPIAARLGWDARPGEADNDAVARAAILRTLGELGDPAVVAEARRRFDRWATDPSSLSGAGRRTVLAIAARNADARTWEIFHEKARSATEPTERQRFYNYLAASEDGALLDRALALAMSGEPRATETPSMIAAVAGSDPDKAFDFAVANRQRLDGLLEPTSRSTYFARLAQGSGDPAMLEKLDRLAATMPENARSEIVKAQATIRYRLAVIRDRLPDMDRWLSANGG